MNIICIIGTRPEAIKMAPIILEFQKNKKINLNVVLTAQHRELVDDVLKIFHIKPDFDLNLMTPNQSLSDLTSILIRELSIIFSNIKPSIVIAQGDTTSVLASALCSFYQKIPFAHIEAGLRTENLYSPYPEEGNRRLISSISTYNFCPTIFNVENLVSQKVPKKKIFLVGNTVVDALFLVKNRSKKKVNKNAMHTKRVLITCHRRESFGKPLNNILEAIIFLVKNFHELEVIFPVHPNPNVLKVVKEKLSNIKNVKLINPQPYDKFIHLMESSFFIISDSGGVQEEASVLGKPILIIRNDTERVEVTKNGIGKIIGTSQKNIIKFASLLLENKEFYDSMANSKSALLYGNGKSASKICKKIYSLID